jgi:hypothetical protein
MEETMPGDLSKIDGLAQPSADRMGFSDDAFDARYDGKQPLASSGTPAAPATAPRPNPHVTSTTPRSRNSFMRARARRSAGSSPT